MHRILGPLLPLRYTLNLSGPTSTVFFSSKNSVHCNGVKSRWSCFLPLTTGLALGKLKYLNKKHKKKGLSAKERQKTVLQSLTKTSVAVTSAMCFFAKMSWSFWFKSYQFAKILVDLKNPKSGKAKPNMKNKNDQQLNTRNFKWILGS